MIGTPPEPKNKDSQLKIGSTKGGKKRKPSPQLNLESSIEEDDDLNFDKNKSLGQVIDETPKKQVTFFEEGQSF